MILQQGKTVKIIENPGDIKNNLAPGNYVVEQNIHTGQFYLSKVDDFKLPAKIYGEHNNLSQRYINTFNNKEGNLGILLRGLKGTGKSLLAKKVCIESELPVLLVTQPYAGTTFETFLESIKEPCIVFIDEFEKIYSSNGQSDQKNTGSQADLLSILDGTFTGKKLFLFTANADLKIASALLNRPGRIHYLRDFKALSDQVISDIIDHNLNDLSKKTDLLKVLFVTGEVNMDSLLTLIKEMNDYDESATQAISHLNIRPEEVTYEAEWPIKIIVGKRDHPDSMSEQLKKGIARKVNTTVLATTRDNVFTNSGQLRLDGYVQTLKVVKAESEYWEYDWTLDTTQDRYNSDCIRVNLSKQEIEIDSDNQMVTIKTSEGVDIKLTRRTVSKTNAYARL